MFGLCRLQGSTSFLDEIDSGTPGGVEGRDVTGDGLSPVPIGSRSGWDP